MQQDFRVESRSYDQVVRGSWRAYRIATNVFNTDEVVPEVIKDCVALWVPAGTPMRWATGTRPLRNDCLQFFWPQRWYMLSAFYRNQLLLHTYAIIAQPPMLGLDRLTYVDLDLSILVKPDLSCEVLTQAEFEMAAQSLHYDEDTRISALMALRTLTSSIQRSLGVFTIVPHYLNQELFNLATCGDKS